MPKLYIKEDLEKAIRSYCKLNKIDDIKSFVNNCTLQGFNIIKFGISPKDNAYREEKGIKEFSSSSTEDVKVEEVQENSKIKVRKIQVIKKND